MKEQDPGHLYHLDVLDGPPESHVVLRFVKRHGSKYPGNTNAYAGTNLQEVIRACIARIKYLNSQIPCEENTDILNNLRLCLWALESRAAKRHNRNLRFLIEHEHIEDVPTCKTCGHIQCQEHK